MTEPCAHQQQVGFPVDSQQRRRRGVCRAAAKVVHPVRPRQRVRKRQLQQLRRRRRGRLRQQQRIPGGAPRQRCDARLQRDTRERGNVGMGSQSQHEMSCGRTELGLKMETEGIVLCHCVGCLFRSGAARSSISGWHRGRQQVSICLAVRNISRPAVWDRCPTSSGSGCSPGGGAAVKGDSSDCAVRGVIAAARAACRSEHMRRHPEGDHTATPRHSQPTWQSAWQSRLQSVATRLVSTTCN